MLSGTVQRLLAIGLLLGGLGGLAGCNPFAASVKQLSEVKEIQFLAGTSNIGDLHNPSGQTSTVVLKGKVSNRIPLVGGTAYELQDSSGQVWVVTKDAAPNQGDEVMIKGVLRYQSIRFNGKEQGSLYVEQQEQMQHLPAVKS